MKKKNDKNYNNLDKHNELRLIIKIIYQFLI